jgi:hypothetical protein
VSCPTCNETLTLPEGAKAGDPVECCGRRYQLTFEYGAFAVEEAEEASRFGSRESESVETPVPVSATTRVAASIHRRGASIIASPQAEVSGTKGAWLMSPTN